MIRRWWRRLLCRLAAHEIGVASARAFGDGYRAGIVDSDHLVSFYREGWEEAMRERDAMRGDR